MIYFTLILVNIVISGVIANSAKFRQISQTKAFMISFLLSPIVGMFVVSMSPESKENLETETIMDIKYPKEDMFVNFFQKYIGYVIVIVFLVILIYKLTHNQPDPSF